MILDDHKKQGKKFIPPLKNGMNFAEVQYVERILPEIIWIAFVIDHLGSREGVRIASGVIAQATSCFNSEENTEWSMISSYSILSEEKKKLLTEALQRENLFSDFRKSIEMFVRVFPKANPLLFMINEEPLSPSDADVMKAKEVIARNYNRWSFDAVVTQSVILYTWATSGKLCYCNNIEPPKLEAIFEDFKSPEAKRASSHVRIATSNLYMFCEDEIDDKWARYFWNRGLELDSLKTAVSNVKIQEKHTFLHPLEYFALEYEKVANGALNAVWEKMPKDIFDNVASEVVGALISRQCQLSLKLARNSDLWEWNIGPLILRSMTDCFITLAWILEDVLLRSKQYISYGLGQQKLLMEHYREQMENEKGRDRESMEATVKKMEGWINNQHFSFLQEVDVGSWSGKSTRQMAMECGCHDLYKFAYTPYSSCAHNMWNHTSRFNCTQTDNPLHKYIRVPAWEDAGGDINVFLNSAKYLEKAFSAVCQKFNMSVDLIMPYEWVLENMERLGSEIRGYNAANHAEKKE